MNLPVLYSFRRCPYAMRARMGLLYSAQTVELREVVLKNKPLQMLELSKKQTVPILLQPDGTVIDESLDILLWALTKSDPAGWKDFHPAQLTEMAQLIDDNDFKFKVDLDHYKYADRFPDKPQLAYRTQGELFLKRLETRLESADFLFGPKQSYADIAIFPFIRQFSKVDESWFQTADYPNLRGWLDRHMNSELFLNVMKKYAPWHETDDALLFGKT